MPNILQLPQSYKTKDATSTIVAIAARVLVSLLATLVLGELAYTMFPTML